MKKKLRQYNKKKATSDKLYKMDDEIIKTKIETMLGNVKIVDCEQMVTHNQEEILLINGVPIKLDDNEEDCCRHENMSIKEALLSGIVPSSHLLNKLLFRAGVITDTTVELETTMSVKQTFVQKEDITLSRNGQTLDSKSTKVTDDQLYASECKELWKPSSNKMDTKIAQIPLDGSGTTTISESSTLTSISSNALASNNLTTTISTDTMLSFDSCNGSDDKVSRVSQIPCSKSAAEGKSFISTDSGHDGQFNSLEHSNNGQTTASANSLSSGCDSDLLTEDNFENGLDKLNEPKCN